jgi:phosphoglycerate dehydrogenase-like enzyme
VLGGPGGSPLDDHPGRRIPIHSGSQGEHGSDRHGADHEDPTRQDLGRRRLTERQTKRNQLPEERERELRVTWEPERDELLRRADFVVLMATYNRTTHKLIGAREFDLMKPSAFFVNTARGRIVDEPALIEALREQKIAGAGLDVYWQEPPVGEPAPSSELFEFPNVILTPHIGSATLEAREAMSLAVVENLRAMIDGRRAPGVVNPEVYGERPAVASDRLG